MVGLTAMFLFVQNQNSESFPMADRILKSFAVGGY